MSSIKGDWYIFRTYEQALEKGLQEALKLIESLSGSQESPSQKENRELGQSTII